MVEASRKLAEIPGEVQPGDQEPVRGLAGWLILVGLGLVLSPIIITFRLVDLYSGVFGSGAWPLLTTPGAVAYNPYWKSLVLGELLANFTLAMASIILMVLFFRRKRQFPMLYVGFVLCGLLFLVVDAFALGLVMPQQPAFDADTVQNLVRPTLHALIWIPYMFVSRRVRATFVN